MTAAQPATSDLGSPLKAIAMAGMVAGAMDITAACLTAQLRANVGPQRVLQYVASGALGQSSFQGGWMTAAAGLAFHFLIAFTWATAFVLASRRIRRLLRHPLLVGPLYGVFVYTIMYWVVVPLSAVRRGPVTLVSTVIAIITHMVCVGSPIVLLTRRYSSK